MQAFPLGRRGQRPVQFSTLGVPEDRIAELAKVPGVKFERNFTVRCAWDAAAPVARMLGREPPRLPIPSFAQTPLPGLDRYRELGLQDVLYRYQKEAVAFLLHRAWALLADPMRSGKSLVALSAAQLLGAERVLIICPAIARLNWAEQVATWLKQDALLLSGRGADEVRWFCSTCVGRGFVDGERCRACRPVKVKGGIYRGQRVVHATTFKPKMVRGVGGGQACVAPFTPVPGRCRRHQFVPAVKAQQQKCPDCLDLIKREVSRANWTVVNYDLLIPQAASFRGMTYERQDLPGWAPYLSTAQYDVIIADELHWLRGRTLGKAKKDGRREACMKVADKVPRVWGLTGTPIYGFVRDLWGQLNFLSGGLYGPKPFNFDARYCEGHRGDYGWEADGASPLAETELKERLEAVMLKRPRAIILAEQPPKTRQVTRIEAEKALKYSRKRKALATFNDRKSATKKALRETFALKLPYVVDALVAEMVEGNKVIAWTYNVDSAIELGKAVEKAIVAKGVARRMREVSARVWQVSGLETSDARTAMARTYREHKGAGAFVATIGSIGEGVSLKGAVSVHFTELHWLPSPLLQAEDRPYEHGCKVSVIYYLIKGSIDEHIESLVMPRLKALEKTVTEEAAGGLIDAFMARGDESESETLEQIWARLSAHVPDDVDEIDDYPEED